MMTVQDLIKKLQELNPDALVHIYCDKSGEPVPPDTIHAANNDDDTATDYHIYSSCVGQADE